MINRELLEECIKKSGMKVSFIAESIGISKAGLYNKISGKSEFKVSEFLSMQKILSLDDETARDIFLPKDVNMIHVS